MCTLEHKALKNNKKEGAQLLKDVHPVVHPNITYFGCKPYMTRLCSGCTTILELCTLERKPGKNKTDWLKTIEERMKNFIQPTDLPGKELAPGKTPRYLRDVSAALSESDSKLITEARAVLDELLYNSSPLHDPKHPRHDEVKKAVAALEAELTRLTLDIPTVQPKPDHTNRPAKN